MSRKKVFAAMSPQKSLRDLTGQAGGPKERASVFVAMSGGVDSSVAALLLKKQGYNVTGVFMRCYNLDGCAERDAEDARRVAGKLNIPFYVWDFEKEYKKLVVDYMIDGYRRGITPNPDVMCNKEIKFGLFLKKALAMGANYVATGHYVRLGFRIQNLEFRNNAKKILNPKSYILYSARDAQKDQSYFLWTLTQEQLRQCLFPIGDYLKPEVRQIAKKAGLPTADKKDSQGICFLGKISLADFLKKHIPERRGAVLTVDGEKIGEHSGAQFYTIGQRHLGIKYQASSIKGRHEIRPVYVAGKDVKTNTLTVAEGINNPALFKKEIALTNVNFINPNNKRFAIGAVPVLARVRYRQPLISASFTIHNLSFKLVFAKPIKFVASGQSAVFYSPKGELVGGGIII